MGNQKLFRFNEPEYLLGIETIIAQLVGNPSRRFNEPEYLLGIETTDAIDCFSLLSVSMSQNTF